MPIPIKTLKQGEFKHEVRQFQKPYDNQQAEQISLM
ncbi:pilus assembly protein, partial [Acinetobacter baumannii]